MRELWWAEAVIPVDREPDWQAAYAAIDGMRLEPNKLEEYVASVADCTAAEVMAAADPATGTGPFGPEGPKCDPWVLQVLHEVQEAVREDLAAVREALSLGRARVCAFEAAGVRVYVHCGGFGGEPDDLCDAWLNVDALGLLQAAGFVKTRVLDGGC